jgi:Spy/CpxP family protein refolding chaperone
MRTPAVIAVLLSASVALAGPAPAPPDDPFGRFLFPPELIMGHQTELGLDEAQRTAIKEAVKSSQSRFLELQWDLHAESEKLAGLLGRPRVDERAALAQAETVMNLEREIKKTHLSLLVRIKNLLSEEQQARLMEIRRRLAPLAPPAPAARPAPAAAPVVPRAPVGELPLPGERPVAAALPDPPTAEEPL